ncbi:MAG: hypothetical protein LLF80_02380 [Porphyromonadaceae bacterium]|nr:hypothetical protein [Porphyromonadaceae bacterium]
MDTKKIYSFFLATLFLFITLSCKKQRISSTEDSLVNTYQELKVFIEKPDSSLTQNELVKRNKLYNLVLEKISIRDNQFYTTASPKDFIGNGLSKYYHDILEKSIKETNQWVKAEGINNLDSMYQISKESAFFRRN